MVERLEDDRAAMEMTHPFDLSDSVQQYDRCAPLSQTTVKVNEQNTQKALSMTSLEAIGSGDQPRFALRVTGM